MGIGFLAGVRITDGIPNHMIPSRLKYDIFFGLTRASTMMVSRLNWLGKGRPFPYMGLPFVPPVPTVKRMGSLPTEHTT